MEPTREVEIALTGPLERPRRGDVHVWTVDLDVPPHTRAWLQRLLSVDELARARRFVFDLHRRRFEVGRARVRQLLALYTGSEPEHLRFAYGEFGRPRLDPPVTGLDFNVAHTLDTLVCAVSADSGIGIDVEPIATPPEADAIARRQFATGECSTFERASESERALVFTRCWTRKEAVIKAIGTGLSLPLQSFEVSLHTHEAPRMLHIDEGYGDAAAWSLAEFTPAPGLLGALAAPFPIQRVVSATCAELDARVGRKA